MHFLPVDNMNFLKPYALQNSRCNRTSKRDGPQIHSCCHDRLFDKSFQRRGSCNNSHPACGWQILNSFKAKNSVHIDFRPNFNRKCWLPIWGEYSNRRKKPRQSSNQSIKPHFQYFDIAYCKSTLKSYHFCMFPFRCIQMDKWWIKYYPQQRPRYFRQCSGVYYFGKVLLSSVFLDLLSKVGPKM